MAARTEYTATWLDLRLPWEGMYVSVCSNIEHLKRIKKQDEVAGPHYVTTRCLNSHHNVRFRHYNVNQLSHYDSKTVLKSTMITLIKEATALVRCRHIKN